MVNVSDDTAMKAMQERDDGKEPPPESTLQRARREFFESLLDPETPQWRKELRLVKEAPRVPAVPIDDLDPRIARALVSAYRADSGSLPVEVRQPMYKVWDRLVATAEGVRGT